MVRRVDLERAVGEGAPDDLLVGGVAGRRGAHVLGPLEPCGVHVVGGEEEVLRAGLAEYPQPPILGPADLLDRLARRDVDDQHRHVDHLGQGDRPVGRLALDRRRVRVAVVADRRLARREELLGEPGDTVVVLGVHHGHGALTARHLEHAQGLAVVELQVVVGEVDLERGVAVADQGRQLLAEHLVARLGDDQVEGVVDDRLGAGATVVVLDHRAQRLSPERHGEGDDRGVAATGGGDASGAEIVRRLDPPVGLLVEVTVAVDPAGQDQHAGRVDLLGARAEGRAERRDPAAAHAHVAAHRVRRGRHRAAPNDQIERRHGPSPPAVARLEHYPRKIPRGRRKSGRRSLAMKSCLIGH